MVHNALSKGVIDGVFLTYEGVKNFKASKYLKYATRAPGGMYATVFQMYMNKKVWNKISKRDQNLIMSVSGEHAANYIGQAWDLADRNGIKDMKAKGIKLVDMPSKMLIKVKKLWKPIQAEWIKKAAKKGVDGNAALTMFKAEITKIEKQIGWKRQVY